MIRHAVSHRFSYRYRYRYRSTDSHFPKRNRPADDLSLLLPVNRGGFDEESVLDFEQTTREIREMDSVKPPVNWL